MVQLIGWTAYATALIVPWLGRYPLSVMWANKVVIAGTGLATSSLLRLMYRRVLRDGASVVSIGAVAVAASVAGAVFWNAIASAILGSSIQHGSVLLGALGRTLPRFDGVLYHTLVLLSWSLLYLGARHYWALAAERERSLRAESLAREARLLALRYQIGPHFLFNALNAISTLVATGRKGDANAMIARLADLLRVSLQPPENGMIALRAELEIVQSYVAIERVRFADRLEVRIDTDARALDVPVPAMILQPLVENAVRHAVAMRDEPTCVTIAAALAGESLIMTVRDDGPGALESRAGFGVGLANTRERLIEAYGDAHTFVAGASDDGGFRVDITIPVRGDRSAIAWHSAMEPQPV